MQWLLIKVWSFSWFHHLNPLTNWCRDGWEGGCAQTELVVPTAGFHISELKHKAVVKAFHKACLQPESCISKASVLFAMTTLVDRNKQGIYLAFKDNSQLMRVICIMSFMHISCLLESLGNGFVPLKISNFPSVTTPTFTTLCYAPIVPSTLWSTNKSTSFAGLTY